MDRWVDKVAVVTGASSGMGAEIAIDLAKHNIYTIALARRVEKISELKNSVPAEVKEYLIPRKCDLNSENDIKKTFKWVEENYGGVDILINNAGIFLDGKIITEGNSDVIVDTVQTNIIAPAFCIREAFRSMKTKENPGHIIIINSVLGHRVGNMINRPTGSMNIYPPTKYAVTAMTEVVRQELLMENTKIKITSISPGLVKTEIVDKYKLCDMWPHLLPKHISDAVLYVLSTPIGVLVHELTICPVGGV